MSQYIHFYLKSNKDEFIPIGTFSRNHVIYSVFNSYAPYEKISPLSKEHLNQITETITTLIGGWENKISEMLKLLDLVKGFNNSPKEKLEIIEAEYECINEYRENINELHYADSFVNFIKMVIEEAEDSYYNDPEHRYDSNHYVYAGIECSCPNINLVKERK